ncbi:MAG: CSLREA domain-containing protein, partial [Paracoccaceae bacterium]
AARTAALKLDLANIALGTGAPIDSLDLDRDADAAEPLELGANGASRLSFLGADIGAYQTALVVNSTLDTSDPNDGVTTLREAIEFVNAAGLAGAASITFDAGLFAGGATITLTQGQLAIFAAMSIDGDVDNDGRADVTLNAGGVGRALALTAGADAAINGLIFTGGSASSGGGIHMVGASTLDLTRSTVTGNAASGDGGGIEVDAGATLTATDVVITANTAGGNGGGMSIYGDVTLTNAEITGNAGNFGGGIELVGGSLTLTNATVHGNTAGASGGGIDAYTGALTIIGSTIAGNAAGSYGGGIYVGDGIIVGDIANTISAGNSAGEGADLTVRSFAPTIDAAILGTAAFKIGTGVTALPGTTVLTDLGLTAADVFATGAPADNGGYGATIALLVDPTNPALGAAAPVGPTDDARGVARVGAFDIGAYEAGPADTASLIVTTMDDVSDENDGLISLREAVAYVQSGALSGAITFATGGTVLLTGGELAVTGVDLIIDGDVDADGAADVTIDAQNASRVLAQNGGSATLNALVMQNGATGGNGGVISSTAGALTVTASTVQGGAAHYGGGIYAYGSTVTLVNAEVRDNAAVYGAGLAMWDAPAADLTNVTIAGNTASNGAGGLMSINGALNLTNVTIAGNEATTGSRGGAWLFDTTGSAVQTTITGNSAGGAVGGIDLNGGGSDFAIANSIVMANTSSVAAQEDIAVTNAASLKILGTVLTGDGIDAATGALTISGTALTLTGLGKSVYDVFLSVDGAGAPALSDAGGSVRTVALADNPINPVFGAGDAALLPADIHDLDGDGDLTEALPLGANGVDIRAGGSDLGAASASFVDLPSLLVTTTADVMNQYDGVTSLREAIFYVNSGALSGDITFAHGAGDAFEFGGTIELNGSELLLTNAFHIDGDVNDDGIADVTLDAGGLSRVLHIDLSSIDSEALRLSVYDIGFNGLVLTNGMAADGGGLLIEGAGDVGIYDSVIIANAAVGDGAGQDGIGGGLLVRDAANVILSDTLIIGNSADLGGGAAVVDGAQLGALGGGIVNNFAAQYGGGVLAFRTNPAGGSLGGTAFFANALIADNIAVYGAGGIGVAANSGVQLRQSTVTGNKAALGAGLLAIDDAYLDPASPPITPLNSGFLLLANSIVAGNGPALDQEVVSHDPSRVLISGGGALLAAPISDLTALAVGTPSIAAGANLTLLSDLPGLGLADVFDSIDPFTGGGDVSFTGTGLPFVALNASFTNPAIDAYVFVPQSTDPIFRNLTQQEVDIFVAPYNFDAIGSARAAAFLDPLGTDLADFGAYELVRQALPALSGALPGGAPVMGDLGGGAARLLDAPSAYDGAAFVNMGRDDGLTFAGATSAAQFSYDGTFLRYDVDLDGKAEATTYVQLAPDAAALKYSVGALGVTVAGAASALTAIGEVVRLTVGTSWQTLSFANTYVDAVVFALSPSLNEVESAATRFRNVSSTGAEIKLQETKFIIDAATGLQVANTSGHVDETVTLLVLEKGVHTLEDGTVIQVGEINTNKLYVKGFESISFDETFATTPTILSQVQTYDGTDFIISRQRNPDGSGFQLTMQEEQADNRNHATETVGWFAVEHGGGSMTEMDWQAGSSAQNVNGNLTRVAFNSNFESAPLVVASLASYNGTDTASPRIGGVSNNAFTAMALEDQSYDLETFHGYEIIDWIGFSNEGTIYQAAAPVGIKIAEAGIASVSSVPISVNFTSEFVNPVVIATITTTVDTGAAVARISNVTSTGFDLRVQETGNLDGLHGAETVSWVVVEAGTWVLADGTMIQAGLSDVSGTTQQGFTSLAFDATFTANPAVLSQTQTENDAAFVKTRMAGVDAAGFTVALEEEEAASWGGHGTETVGWIAVDKGLASAADGFVFEAGDISTNHNWKAETFTGPFDEAPGVVAGMATFSYSDTADTRVRAVSGTGFEVHVEEDTSLNPEITHGVETFHWIAFNGVGELFGDALV